MNNSNPVSVNGVTLTLEDFKKLNINIAAADIASGPLTNISSSEMTGTTTYTVTAVAYIPSNQLNPVSNQSGLPLQKDDIYLNYYGVINVNVLDKNGNPVTYSCRDFRVEFNCDEIADTYDLYYVQFTYTLEEGTEPVDMIYVRDDNEDPETDRGTVSVPTTGGQ
ncbi:hypothetical protein P8625_06290 [Tenacibaculum tangerinum]|uniref:Uncharacterized protein n=1 Tax=Tenacibaculum tangerinum TaxID=3038772 RepID=A0ABY8L656_9FLAO|nr:hypothetical protein [Tenacibaculum tangerinum]WGH76761.1 hypothetical protein P8625_06290 [Tenacibaculum tangerinum]